MEGADLLEDEVIRDASILPARAREDAGDDEEDGGIAGTIGGALHHPAHVLAELVTVQILAVDGDQPMMKRMVVVDSRVESLDAVDDGVHLEWIASAAARVVPH